MSSAAVIAIVEGQTEQTFIREVLAPELAKRSVFISAALLGRPGHKGGNVSFVRALDDIGRHLKQRPDTYVTTLLDFFRIDPGWPGRSDIGAGGSARAKAAVIERATLAAVKAKYPSLDIDRRFLPYVAMHEFEALLFSEAGILADALGVTEESILEIIQAYGEPEAINDRPQTAPSKRIAQLRRGYRKVTMGSSIARSIGIGRMRRECPHFDRWLTRLEQLPSL